MGIKKVEISKVVEGYSPRRNFKGIEELKKSIEKEGLLEPLLVRKDANIYVIIDGNMRFRAVKDLGWKSVECIIEDADAKRSCHLFYVKNTERNNLNPIEISLHIKEMRETYGYSVQDLVELGYAGDDQTLYNKLSLLKLPKDVQEKIAEGTIKPTEGYKIAAVKDSELQSKVIDNVCMVKNRSVRKTERIIRDLIDSENRKKDGPDSVVQIPKGDIPGVFFKDSSDMSELADESVNLVLTSMPYSVRKEYEEGVSFEEHYKNINGVFKEGTRVLVSGCKFCVNVGDILTFGSQMGGKPEIELVGSHIQQIMRNHGLRLIDRIIWKKALNWVNNPQVSYHEKIRHTSYRILNNLEYIYIFQKDGKREVPFDVECESKISKEEWKKLVDGVWEFPPVSKQKGHPAQFPEELPRRLIKMFSYKGDIVLDPFGGTMTTVKVANELGRIGIGYEIDEKYKPAIMKKLGITEKDLKSPEPVADKPDTDKTKGDLVHQVQGSIQEILDKENKTTRDIVSVQIPLKSVLQKEDVVVNFDNNEEDPDPSGSSPLPQMNFPDDYEGDQDAGSKVQITACGSPVLLPEKCETPSPRLNKIILGDCRAILREIPNDFVDLALSSPPYANVKDYGEGVTVFHPDHYVDWILPLFEEIFRVLKPSGSFILNINDRIVNKQRHTFVHELILRATRETGLKLYDQYFWFKKTALPNGNSKRLNSVTEYLLHFCKDENLVKWNMDAVREAYNENTLQRCQYPVGSFNLDVDEKGRPKARARKIIQLNENGKIPSNVFHFPTASAVRGKRHPAAFHPDLPSWFIRALTDEGDLVLEPFAGSGTTCKVAKELNRNFIGIELNEEYHRIASESVNSVAMAKAA